MEPLGPQDSVNRRELHWQAVLTTLVITPNNDNDPEKKKRRSVPKSLRKSITVHQYQTNNVGIECDRIEHTELERCLWHIVERKKQSGKQHIGSHLYKREHNHMFTYVQTDPWEAAQNVTMGYLRVMKYEWSFSSLTSVFNLSSKPTVLKQNHST